MSQIDTLKMIKFIKIFLFLTMSLMISSWAQADDDFDIGFNMGMSNGTTESMAGAVTYSVLNIIPNDVAINPNPVIKVPPKAVSKGPIDYIGIALMLCVMINFTIIVGIYIDYHKKYVK